MEEVYKNLTAAALQFAIVALNIAIPIALAYGLRYLHLKAAELKSKLSQENSYLVDVGTKIVVKAVEQMGANGELDDKKAEAEKLLGDWLEARGINLPVDELSAKIESVVWSEFNDPTLPDTYDVQAEIEKLPSSL